MLIITSMISISISFPTNINVSKKPLSSQETVSLNIQFLLTFVDNFSSIGTCSIPLPFLYLSSHYHLLIFVLFFNNLKSIHQISLGYKFMPMHLFSSFFFVSESRFQHSNIFLSFTLQANGKNSCHSYHNLCEVT